MKQFDSPHWRRRNVWHQIDLCRNMKPPYIRVDVVNRVDDQRLTPLSKQKQAGMDLRHHTMNVGQERFTHLSEQWNIG